MLLEKLNRATHGESNRTTITLPLMSKQRRSLTAEEKNDARRLEAIWLRQKKILGLTQEQIAMDCGWTTQGAFNQYLRGAIPLNVKAALKIAKALRVEVSDFSPRLSSFLPAATASLQEKEIAYPVNQEENQQFAAWTRLYYELQREGMADAGLRLIILLLNCGVRSADRHLAKILVAKKQDKTPTRLVKKKREPYCID